LKYTVRFSPFAKKQFDCIAMKSYIQKQIYDETKNMTANELLLYFNGNEGSTKVSDSFAEITPPDRIPTPSAPLP